MTRIYFRCRRCQRALSDQIHMAGRPAVCPNCKVDMIVPLVSEMAPPAPASSASNPMMPSVAETMPAAALAKTAPEGAAKSPFPAVLAGKTTPHPERTKSISPSVKSNRARKWSHRAIGLAAVATLLLIAADVTSRVWSKTDQARDGQTVQAEDAGVPGGDDALDASNKSLPDGTAKGQNEISANIANSVVERDIRKTEANPANKAGNALVIEKEAMKKQVKGPARAGALITRRRDQHSEEELRKDLAWAKEIGLGKSASKVLSTFLSNLENKRDLAEPLALLHVRPDLRGLPLLHGRQACLSGADARTLSALGPKLRAYLDLIAPADLDGHRPKPVLLRETLRAELRGKRPEWLRVEALPALLQILMGEDQPIRLLLVEILAEVKETKATVALAQRAVFDLSSEVRASAVKALRDRKAEDYRPVFLRALRYPFSPVADHAAEALVALEDRNSVGPLVALLKEPDPSAPVDVPKNAIVVKELVRVTHQANCLLCHPPALSKFDPVLREDPIVTIPAKIPTLTPSKYGGVKEGTTNGPQVPVLIRGDVTYVRQDFAVLQPVSQAGTTLPAHLRFDYFVRVRKLSGKKAVEFKKKYEEHDSYSQRDAVLYALRELTGQDAGPTTAAWQKLYPTADLDAEAAELSANLVNLSAKRREKLLIKYQETEGEAYTRALADAIPKVPKESRDKVCTALAERLSRMTADDLRDSFQSDNRELRKASIQACVLKGDKDLISDLSELQEDPETEIADLASEAIQQLTKPKSAVTGPPEGGRPQKTNPMEEEAP